MCVCVFPPYGNHRPTPLLFPPSMPPYPYTIITSPSPSPPPLLPSPQPSLNPPLPRTTLYSTVFRMQQNNEQQNKSMLLICCSLPSLIEALSFHARIALINIFDDIDVTFFSKTNYNFKHCSETKTWQKIMK